MRSAASARSAFVLAGTPAVSFATVQSVSSPPPPIFQQDGTVQCPAFAPSPSDLASKDAGDGLRAAAQLRQAGVAVPGDIVIAPKHMEAVLIPLLGTMEAQYPVDGKEQRIAAVRSRISTPKGRSYDQKRMLINLHGGAFSVCADARSRLESMPIASIGGFKGISVDYRMAPEFKHPADVDSTMIVGEGPGRCFIYKANLPEARNAYKVIVRFFATHLG